MLMTSGMGSTGYLILTFAASELDEDRLLERFAQAMNRLHPEHQRACLVLAELFFHRAANASEADDEEVIHE